MTDVTIQFEAGTKPAAASSTDGGRPTLQGVWIEQRKEGPFAIATDSYKLVEVPVRITDGELPKDNDKRDKDGNKSPLWLPAEVVADATKHKRGGRVRVTDSAYEPQDGFGQPRNYTYRRETDGIGPRGLNESSVRMPDRDKLWPTEDRTTFKVGFNARFLADVAKAIGGEKTGIAIEFDVTHIKKGQNTKPIVVTPLRSTPGARALLMPVRIDL